MTRLEVAQLLEKVRDLRFDMRDGTDTARETDYGRVVTVEVVSNG